MNDKTRERIEQLRADAADHGDGELVLICDDALVWDNKKSALVCLGVIRYHRGKASE